MDEKEQIKIYHEALNDLLALFIMLHGWDNAVVDKAINAIKLNLDLPITAGFFKENGGVI